MLSEELSEELSDARRQGEHARAEPPLVDVLADCALFCRWMFHEEINDPSGLDRIDQHPLATLL